MKFRVLFFTLGLLLFSYGIAVAIQVQFLGIHPWDVLNVALFEKFGLTIGSWNLMVGLLLVAVSYGLDKTYIKIGKILNAVSVGPLIDLYLYLGIFPMLPSLTGEIVVLLIGMVLMGVGGGMYSAAGIGAGPRDGFMLSISDKLGTSISKTRIVTESSVLILGLILGGPVFVFTFLYTFIQSPIFQLAYQKTEQALNRILTPKQARFGNF